MSHTEFNLINTFNFAEWIAERYNYIGGEYDGCWCAKQYSITDTSKYKQTSDLWIYWSEEEYFKFIGETLYKK